MSSRLFQLLSGYCMSPRREVVRSKRFDFSAFCAKIHTVDLICTIVWLTVKCSRMQTAFTSGRSIDAHRSDTLESVCQVVEGR